MNCIIDGKEYNLEVIKEENKECFGGEIITTIFKCPLCGEGVARLIDEDTPGDRGHNFYIDCEKCNPGHYVFKSSGRNVMELKSRTGLEIAREVVREHEEITKHLPKTYEELAQLRFAKSFLF